MICIPDHIYMYISKEGWSTNFMATKSPMSDEEFVEGGDPLLSGENR